MEALTAYGIEADLQGNIGAVQGLLVVGHQSRNALRRSSDRGIVNVLGCVELVSNVLEISGELRPAADAFRETLAIG